MRRAIWIISLFLLAVSAFGVDQATCPHPGISGITVTPTTPVIAGTADFDVTLSFGGAMPQGCQEYYNTTTSHPQQVNICGQCNFFADGTDHVKSHIITRVVDSQQNVTVTFQARRNLTGSTPVIGNPVSTTVTLQPIKILSFNVASTTITDGQSTTGTVLMEKIIGNLGGSAKVLISANPATAVTVPASIQIQCCTIDNAGHAKGTFTITGKSVFPDKQVVISVQRPNQTPLTRTITVKTRILKRP